MTGVQTCALPISEVGSVTLSLGVAAGQAASSAIDTVNRADQALYAAKEQGRNRVLADRTSPDARPGTLAGPVGL